MRSVPLTRVAQFRAQGYLVAPGLISRTFVQHVGEFLAQSVSDSVAELRRELGIEDGADLVREVVRRLGGGAPLATHPRQVAMGHFPLAVRLSQDFWKIAEEHLLLELISELIGSDEIMLHLPPAARFVLPGNGFAGVPAHQDCRYNAHLPAGFVTVWVPFVEIDDDCGGVIVYDAPRDRELPLLPAKGPWLGGVDTARYTGRHIKIAPGDALLLDPTVLHESAPNRSNRVRLSTDFRFFAGRSEKDALRLRDRTVIHAEENS